MIRSTFLFCMIFLSACGSTRSGVDSSVENSMNPPTHHSDRQPAVRSQSDSKESLLEMKEFIKKHSAGSAASISDNIFRDKSIAYIDFKQMLGREVREPDRFQLFVLRDQVGEEKICLIEHSNSGAQKKLDHTQCERATPEI